MKKKLLIASSFILLTNCIHADNIRPLLSVDLGLEGGTIDDDYSAVGYLPESYEHDYAGANFRLAGGIAIEHNSLESRIKVYLETASGEVEFDRAFSTSNEDIASKEMGLSYDLVISQEGLQPFFGIELGAGSSKFDVPGAVKVNYNSFGLYGGILYPINENLDFSARVGYKGRYYDDYSEFVSGIGIITEETSYSGIDLKIGLTYVF